MMGLPIIGLVMKSEAKSVLPVLLISAVLGSLVGLAGDKLAGEQYVELPKIRSHEGVREGGSARPDL